LCGSLMENCPLTIVIRFTNAVTVPLKRRGVKPVEKATMLDHNEAPVAELSLVAISGNAARCAGANFRRILWPWVQSILAILLFCAVATKLRAGYVEILPGRQLPPVLLAVLMQTEVILGMWLLSGWLPKHSRLFGLVLFGLFLALNVQAILQGAKACQCFGSIGLSTCPRTVP